MGKGAGFLGQYVILCAIFISLCYKTKPVLVVHECTPRFPFGIFQETLATSTDFHSLLNAADFGVPVQRNRAWDAVVSNKWILPRGLSELHQLSSKCVLDASLWLVADFDEACLSEDLPDGMPDRMSEDMPDRISEDMPDRMSEDMTDRMPKDMPDRMSEDMPDRMSEDLPDGMPDRMSEDLPDGMPIECQKICQMECQIECQIKCQKIFQTECHGGDHSKQSKVCVLTSFEVEIGIPWVMKVHFCPCRCRLTRSTWPTLP